ncbi:alpha/beta hydrolase [Streptomyces sp. NPDC004111]|uniref:alpha/beta hydrolase n=1 Tax=Streptomyces sp. NPDC004111 TaxID=3364690 RepID=UPI003682BE76
MTTTPGDRAGHLGESTSDPADGRPGVSTSRPTAGRPADWSEHTRRALALFAAHGGGDALPPSVEAARSDPAVAALAGPAAQTRAGETPAATTGAVSERSLDGPGGPLPVRIYRPAAAGASGPPLPGIVYFHGGGFVVGGLDSHHAWVSALCEATGRVVVAVDYRLAPEHPFPAAAEDALAATLHIATYAVDFGIDPVRLAVAGDSAGANLAAGVARCAARAGLRLDHQVLVVPWLTPAAPTPSRTEYATGYGLTDALLSWFLEHYAQPGRYDDPLLNPGLADDLTGLAPATVVTAGLDPLRDEGQAYAGRLRAAGVDVRHHRLEGAFHLFNLAGAVGGEVIGAATAVVAERLRP